MSAHDITCSNARNSECGFRTSCCRSRASQVRACRQILDQTRVFQVKHPRQPWTPNSLAICASQVFRPGEPGGSRQPHSVARAKSSRLHVIRRAENTCSKGVAHGVRRSPKPLRSCQTLAMSSENRAKLEEKYQSFISSFPKVRSICSCDLEACLVDLTTEANPGHSY